jgi:glycosyltransferase involved in cell wall biosynthesis
MRVLANMWPYFVLSHVGDFYANTEVFDMAKQFPDMEFLLVRSPLAVVAANARALGLRLAHKSGLARWRFQPLVNLECTSYLPAGYVRRMKPDVIFAHGHTPRVSRRTGTPLVAVEYFASERHLRMAGVDRRLPWEIRAKRRATEYADVILTTTPMSQARFEANIPEAKGRVWQAPIYMPYLDPIPEADVVRKTTADDLLDVLFVGGAAHRKGLPQVLQAFDRLDRSVRERLRLTVVSNFDDGKVAGLDQSVIVRSGVGSAGVARLMRDAHIFVFPTQFDTYGRVIVEAMANGCAIVTSDTDPQDWLVDYGRAGLLVDPDAPEEIAVALTRLTEQRALRAELAEAAVRRFREVFHHRVVGERYRLAFETAIGRRTRSRT